MITKNNMIHWKFLFQNLNKNHFFQTGERGEGGEGGVWRRKAKCPEVEEDKEEKEKDEEILAGPQAQEPIEDGTRDPRGLKKNPCFVDDDDDTGEKGRVRI